MIGSAILDALFPARCVACREPGDWWCADCRTAVERPAKDPCARCLGIGSGHACARSVAHMDAVVVAGFYHDPKLRAAIHALKYRGATCLVPAIDAYLSAWKRDRAEPWPWAGVSDLGIQRIPPSASRERERGFDQAALVAQSVSRILLPWGTTCDALRRADGGEMQAHVDPGPLRRGNVLGAFSVLPGASVPPTVLLVDDVVTTGSTMDEAARVVRAAGATRVIGFALAIGT